jgi:hypothetical protein
VEDPIQHGNEGNTKGKSKKIPEPVIEQTIPSNHVNQTETYQRTKDGGDLDMIVDENDLANIDLE